jgi:hypothetical protein
MAPRENTKWYHDMISLVPVEEEQMTADKKSFQRLRRGHTTVGRWKLTLDLDTQRGICWAHDTFNIKMKCKYL